MVRSVVVMLVLATQVSGCAWLFQDKVPSGYDGSRARAEPRCSTGSGWAAIDGVFAVLSGLGAIAAASDDTEPNQSAYVLSSAGWALIHGASALSGVGWASECRKAYAAWNSEDEPDVTTARSARTTSQPQRPLPPPDVEDEPTVVARTPPARAAAAALPVPRGFFCATSISIPTAALCTREKDACLAGRHAILGAVPDLGACTLVETAFCFDAGSGDETERCAPTEPSCVAQRDAASPSLGACVEQR